MKQILSLGGAALLVALATGGSADAWSNSKFSVGLNWSCQSGNNSLLWGVWRNGQIPEDYANGGGGGGHGGPALPPGYGPPYPPGTQPFPWYGSNQTQQSMPTANYPTPQMPNVAAAPDFGNNNQFHTASYQQGYQQGYTPNYYTPGYTPNYYGQNYYMPSYGSGYGYGYGDPYGWYYQR